MSPFAEEMQKLLAAYADRRPESGYQGRANDRKQREAEENRHFGNDRVNARKPLSQLVHEETY